MEIVEIDHLEAVGLVVVLAFPRKLTNNAGLVELD